MNKNELDFLKLYSMALSDSISNFDFSFDETVKIALKQNVSPLLLPVFKSMCDSGLLSKEQFDAFSQSVMPSIIKNMTALTNLKAILKDFDKAGIEVVVLKGESLALNYPHPEYRISSDIDLYIDKKDELSALKILKKRAISVSPRENNQNHSVCQSRVYGTIELHVSLYGGYYEGLVFKNTPVYTQPKTELASSFSGKFFTFGPNDNLRFIFSHAVKHFIERGFGIRHVSDLLCFIKKHRHEIDADAFFKFADSIGMHGFFDAICTIGAVYLGFDDSDMLCYTKTETAALLLTEDILEGGVFGFEGEKRKSLAEKYSSEDIYKEFIAKFYVSSALSRLSFNKDGIKRKYSFAAAHPFLLPLAYARHAFFCTGYILKRIPKLFYKKPVSAPAAESEADVRRNKLFEMVKPEETKKDA